MVPFTTVTKIINYLGRNLPKEAKDMYAENDETPMKKIKDDTYKWRDILCSWIGTINIMKITIYYTKQLHIKCNSHQITNGIFHRTRKKSFTIFMEIPKTPNSQSNLEKEEWS